MLCEIRTPILVYSHTRRLSVIIIIVSFHFFQAKFKKMAQRRQSAPSIVIRGVLGRPTKPQSAFQGRDDNALPYSPNVNSQRLSLKFGSHGATLNLSKRKYVMEGKVQLTAGMQTQDRYMFLFTDLLLIAKAK